MSEYVFLFKEKNTKDRDCVKYIDLDDLKKIICAAMENLMCRERAFVAP